MLSNILKKYSIGVVALLGCILILLFYGKYIFNPNGYLFSGGGDGVKNYYTFGWHVQYDSSYTHFEGMNYPYGEHIVFTDNQPLFSNILKWINGTGINVGAYSVGIVNLLMFIGLLLALILLYKLFFAFTGATLFSITMAISVGLLSPQVIRITEHFALAYCFVIPLFIWLIYKFFKKPSWGQSAVIGLALLLLLYIHLYYIVIIGGMLLALWLVFLIHKQTGLGFLKSMLHIGVQVIVPLALYFIWLKTTDTITDRPTEPFGMVEFAAHWEGLLLPMGFEYFKPIENALHIREISSESFSYAGLPVLLFVVISLIAGIIKLFKKKQKAESTNVVERPFEKMFIAALLIASVLVFCYAAFSPLLFKIEALAQYLGLLKQFRSLGRLLWVPFYALNIFVAVYLFNKYKNSTQLKFIPWLVPLLIFVDAALLNIRVANRLDLPKPTLSWIPAEINPKNYRAIIPQPFFHEGSENVDVKSQNNFIVEQSLLASWQTGIPLQAVKMSRTSISQTLAQAELGFEFTLLPQILSDDTTRPYLLLVDEKQALYLPEIKQLQPVAIHNNIKLYSITKNTIKAFLDARAAKALNEAQTLREVIEATHNSFDTLPSKQVYMGKGALTIPPKQTVSLYNGRCGFCYDSVTVSFWLYANMEGIAQPKLLITSGGELERVQPVYYIKAVSRQWALIEYKFLPKGGDLKIEVMKEADVQTQPMYVDEFSLRRHDYYLYNDSFVMKNNRFYQLPR